MNPSSFPPLVTMTPSPGPGPDPGPSPHPGPSAPPITLIQNQIAHYGYALLFILGSFGHTSSFFIFLRPTLYRISTSC
jgi:hypothetical protein